MTKTYTILTCLGDIIETEHVTYKEWQGATTSEVLRVGSVLFSRNTPLEERPVGLVCPTPCSILNYTEVND